MKKQDIKVDIHAVARAAGVSISTVSRSFNHPNLVNAATRKKIDRAVKKLGYIRNRAAQAMHGKRSGTIGLIVPTIDHAIFGEVVQAFTDTLDAAGFTILMSTHGFDLAREYQLLRKMLEHRVDGIALVGLDHSAETFQLLQEQQTPCIAMWTHANDSTMSCVGPDNREAGQIAAQQLLAHGHTRIATIFPAVTDNDRARNRLAGAMQALNAADVSVPEGWQTRAPYSVSEAKRVCLDMLGAANKPSALLCGNDAIAQGAIYAALALGIKVPQDLSIVGIGDFKGSGEIIPGLTTIRLPARRIGTIAGDKLVALVRHEAEGPLRYKCDLRLIERGSIGPAPTIDQRAGCRGT